MSLQEFQRQWAETRAKQLRPSTVELYVNTFNRLKDFFGRYKQLGDITPQQADKFVADQRNISATRKGEPLSQSSRNQIVRNCRTLFNIAIKWKYLQFSPFDDLDTPETSSNASIW